MIPPMKKRKTFAEKSERGNKSKIYSNKIQSGKRRSSWKKSALKNKSSNKF